MVLSVSGVEKNFYCIFTRNWYCARPGGGNLKEAMDFDIYQTFWKTARKGRERTFTGASRIEIPVGSGESAAWAGEVAFDEALVDRRGPVSLRKQH